MEHTIKWKGGCITLRTPTQADLHRIFANVRTGEDSEWAVIKAIKMGWDMGWPDWAVAQLLRAPQEEVNRLAGILPPPGVKMKRIRVRNPDWHPGMRVSKKYKWVEVPDV